MAGGPHNSNRPAQRGSKPGAPKQTGRKPGGRQRRGRTQSGRQQGGRQQGGRQQGGRQQGGRQQGGRTNAGSVSTSRRVGTDSSNQQGGRTVKTREPAASRLTGRAIVLLSVVLLLLASYTSSLHTWWSQHQEIESTKAAIATKKAQIADLEDMRKRLDDDAYIQQQARRRFGWVMPGEVGYRVIGVDGKIEGDAPELAEPTGDKPREWYAKLWGTVNKADKDPADKPDDADKVLKDK